jgi:hypothetical protein
VVRASVWGGSRTWAGARAQSVLMSVWRTCWEQGRSALDFLGQLLRGTSVAWALPPDVPRTLHPRASRTIVYPLTLWANREPSRFRRGQTLYWLFVG